MSLGLYCSSFNKATGGKVRANIIRVPNPDMAYMLTSGAQQTQQAVEYFKQGYESFTNRMSSLGQDFANGVSNMFNYYNDSSMIQNTKELLTTSGLITGEDIIYRLDDNNIHNPGYLMRRYVMAEPGIYDKYVKNRCSGYEDEWFNPEPYEKVATMREDYLNVTEGLIQYDKDDHAYTTFVSTEDGNNLSVIDRFTIQDAWDIVRDKMIHDIDPSDMEMGELG